MALGPEINSLGLQYGNGVYLTWQDLWVTVSTHKNGTKPLLQGLTGYASPAEVLAVMGPSGCGKSTLLDALAGRLSSRARQKGEILINGRRQNLAYGTSAYVTQEDALTWTLTVKEAIYYSAQLQLPATMPESKKRDIADNTIKEMGLQESTNTRIGEWGRKGLSNGQKIRVSICIELVKRPNLLFLDEPTSGLDSAASYFIVNRVVKLARDNQMTVVLSIHQPTSQVFHLLHNLCLLSSGRMVYFGPSSSANQFFAANGFPCPALQNPADHYLKMINTDFYEDVEKGNGSLYAANEVIGCLEKSYSISNVCSQMKTTLIDIRNRAGEPIEKKARKANLLTQCLILTRRSFINMNRDLGYYWLRLAIYVALALGLGSVFYDVGNSPNSIQERGSMLMFVASLLTMMSIGGFPSFVQDLKVFRHERLNGHYSVVTYVVANMVSSTPFLLLISAIPGAITYFLAGLRQPESIEFFYFIMVLFASMMLVENLMMIVASLMPNFLLGLIVGAGIQGLMMLSGGFFQLPKNLPRIFWKYPMYYVAFHKYAFQGLYKNEFGGRRFGSVDGDSVLRDVWQVEMGYSKWVDLAVLFGMVVVYRIVFFVVVKLSEKSIT